MARSGGIVGSVVTPHTPRMAIEANAPDFARPVIEGSKELGRALAELEPDLIVMNSSHWVSTFNWYATCQSVHRGVCVADEAPDMVPGIPYERKGDPEFAGALVSAIAARGMPAFRNETEHYKWDYGSLVPLLYLDPQAKIPVVLIPTCIIASLEECLSVGEAIRETAEKTDRRTVFVASCSLSHKLVRGPHLWPTDERMATDRRFIDMLRAGRIAEAKAWLPDYCREVVAEVGGRNLATMLGCLDENSGTTFIGDEYGPYGQSSGSGNISVAVRAAA